MNSLSRTIVAGLANGLAGSLMDATAFLAVDVLMPVHAQFYRDFTPIDTVNKKYSYCGGANLETWSNGSSSTIIKKITGRETSCEHNGNYYDFNHGKKPTRFISKAT